MATQSLYTIIRFSLVSRKTGERRPCWLASVSYADGPGMKVKKMTTTTDREKAARFSLSSAHAIAEQFSQFPASLERPDGTAMPEESAKLLEAQATRHAEVLRINAEIRAEFNKAFEPLRPLLLKAIGRNS